MHDAFSLTSIARLRNAKTRSISAENPAGAVGGGAQASPGDDEHCTSAADQLGRGWKVRPCLKNFTPGRSFTLADIEGPGVVQHIWMTVLDSVHRWIRLEVYYDDCPEPSIRVPLGDFFANGLDGRALVDSLPIAVNPKGGMNSYWPMPFRKRMRMVVTNDGPETINELFFQVTYSLEELPDDAAYLHAAWNRATTDRAEPDFTVLDTIHGRGHYAGTYMIWSQLANGWWGEGEVKFFMDGDAPGAPTICGTGTEDYFGGAWGFVMDHKRDMRPKTYTTAFLGYPQAIYEPTDQHGPRLPEHALYRWHIPDPVRFETSLRVTMQALGWWPGMKYQPLADDIAATAYFYLDKPTGVPELGEVGRRYAR